MKIILMRHGKPTWNDTAWRSAAEMQQWCDAYDQHGISDAPPASCRQLAAEAAYRVSSPLPRALASLDGLGAPPNRADALYREVALPVPTLRFPPLPPTLWLPLLRVMWLCGYAGRVESWREARLRARRAAADLIVHTRHGNVLLMGHGIMNKLIARELRRQGWLGDKQASSRYWGTAVFCSPPG